MNEIKKWSVTSAVVTGLSHLTENTPCQDKVSFTPVQNGVNHYAAALADGVGSLKNSHIAAKVATEAALDWLTEHRDLLFAEQAKEKEAGHLKNLAAMMLEKIRREIREQAERQDMDVRSMDCNLAFCFVDETQGKALVGQLGDCAVCIICDDSDMSYSRVLNQQGMLANSTDTVLSKGSEGRVNMQVIPLSHKGPKGNRRLYGFILTSDGLENVLYRKGSKYVCKQAEYCFGRDSRGLRELLTDAQESSRGYLDDDLSVVVLSCVEGKIELPKEPYWICRECGAENLGMESRCHKCGAEMLSMYPRADIERAGSAEAYFEWLHRKGGMDPTTARDTVAGKAGKQVRKDTKRGKTKTDGRSGGTIDTSGEVDAVQPGRTGSGGNLAWIGGSLKGAGVTAENGNGYDPASNQKGEYRQDAVAGAQGTGMVTKIIIGVLVSSLVVLMALLIVMGVRSMIPQSTVPTTEPGNVQIHDTLPPNNDEIKPGQSNGEGIRLEDGTVFFGRVRDGKPSGWGTLIDEENSRVYSGYFVMGAKNGVFTVTTYKDLLVEASVVFYQNDMITDIYYGEVEEPVRDAATVAHNVQLYAEPSYESKPTVDEMGNNVRLREGDTVYLTHKETVDDNGNKWCQIETADGVTGWCEGAAIHRFVRENSENSGDPDV